MKAVALLVVCVVSGVLVDKADADQVGQGQAREPATLSGRVLDISDNVLAGATVEVEPRGLQLTTDRDGRFMALNLPSGDYQLKISYVGFRDDQESVKVDAGAHVSLEAKLQPQLSETVTVTASRAHGEVSALN